MARKSRRAPEPHRPLNFSAVGGRERKESYGGETWVVRSVSAGSAQKTYRCPGCDHEIMPGITHVVVWPEQTWGAFAGVDDRRHWHTFCWSARDRRR